jgi:nitrogen regulatory protein PII
MKRVEAIIKSDRLESTIGALQKAGVPATIYESKGVGKGEKYTIKYGLGTGSAKMLYSDRKTIVTIVEDERVKESIDVIRSAAGSEAGNTGVIFVSPVDEVVAI